jgi:GxxExxY protein
MLSIMLLQTTVTKEILGAALEVHRTLGPGLLESVYEQALCHELSLRSIPFQHQVELPVHYKGQLLGTTLRMDLVVADAVIVEIKAVEQQLSIHTSQLLTYLRLSGYRVGLLINFNVPLLRNGILRRVL